MRKKGCKIMHTSAITVASSNYTNLASLKESWNKGFGSFFDQGVGAILANLMALGAAIIFLFLVAGWLLKAAGRSGWLVSTFANSGKTALFYLFIIMFLAMPKLIPIMMGLGDLIINWLSDKTTEFSNASGFLDDGMTTL